MDDALRAGGLSEETRHYIEACARAGAYAIALLPALARYRESELTDDLRAGMGTRDGQAQARRVATWIVLTEGYATGSAAWEAKLSRARRVVALEDREWPVVTRLAGLLTGAAGGPWDGTRAPDRLVRFSELSFDWLCATVGGRPLRPRGDTRFWLVDEYARLYFAWRQVLLAALAERRRRLAR